MGPQRIFLHIWRIMPCFYTSTIYTSLWKNCCNGTQQSAWVYILAQARLVVFIKHHVEHPTTLPLVAVWGWQLGHNDQGAHILGPHHDNLALTCLSTDGDHRSASKPSVSLFAEIGTGSTRECAGKYIICKYLNQIPGLHFSLFYSEIKGVVKAHSLPL